MNCERCRAGTKGFELHDYCAVCSKNLCAACMAEGCCGNVPATSGHAADDADDADDPGDALGERKMP